MSIDYQGSARHSPEHLIAEQEALTRSAQNFLIGVGLAVHRAKEQSLLYPTEGERSGELVYVATSAGTIGFIRVIHKDGLETFSLQPLVPYGLYGRSAEIDHETIEAIDGATALSVKMYGHIGVRNNLNELSMMGRTERVTDTAKARVLEEFVRELRPLTQEEYSAMFKEQRSHLQEMNKVGFAKKIGRLLSRKSSH
jgi:hypothetical protein